MRKWAALRPDCRSVDGTSFRKIMLYPCAEGVYVFLYDTDDAVFCTTDEFCESEEEALERWEEEIDPDGWHVIDDPLPGCQHDSILPIRVKGRDQGAPQWGEYEILTDGKWVDYVPE